MGRMALLFSPAYIGKDMGRTKFNVNQNADERTADGISFDSKLEMRYYTEVVLPGAASGDITKYELQKKYILQDGFERNGKKILPITYVADFYVEHADGAIEVIDTKGLPDNVALLKRKMFWKKFPDIDFRWVQYIKKFGGWINYDDAKELRRKEKLKKKKENEK